jgi:hypothetical protein
MYRRMIFIGLGGSGGKTLRFLKRDLYRWLDQTGWKKGMPEGWQFLHIDTPTVQDGASVAVPMLPDSEYLGLVGAGVGYPGIVGALDAVSDSEMELEGWRVDPTALGVPVGQGAGQFRAVGRTIALAYLEQIQTRMQVMINRVNSAGAVTQLESLWAEIYGDDAGNGGAADPIVVIVSSLAGGTGAGLFMDVCDLMRSMASPWGGNSFALLYTPEVFSSLGTGATGGVQPNSLAAVSELMNGYWLHGGVEGNSAVPPRTSPFHTNAGAPTPIERSGPAFPMLIGSTGGTAGISFGTDVEVFDMVGRALMSWATDPVIQQDFLAFEIGNWASAAAGNRVNAAHDVLINAGSAVAPKEVSDPVFSSLGFSRVSLGNTYYLDYARQRLALDSARWAVEAVRHSGDAAQYLRDDPSLTDSEVADLVASNYLEWFLRQTKLHERGPKENDVLDALFPKEKWHAEVAALENWVLNLTGITALATANTWQEALASAVYQGQQDFYETVRPYVDDHIRHWIKSTQERIIETTETAIAQYGLHVGAALLDASITELSEPDDGISDELRGEATEAETFAQAWEQQIRAALGHMPGKLAPQNAAVQQAIADSIKYATQNLYSYLIKAAAEMIDSLCDGFLRPLQRSVGSAAAGLDHEMDELAQWPAWDSTSTPKALEPPKSEVTVLNTDDFPSDFNRMLADTVGGSKNATGNHRIDARHDILSGSEIRDNAGKVQDGSEDLESVFAVDISSDWWPAGVLVQDGRPQTKASFHVRYASTDLLDRADHWLNRSGTPFESIATSSLAKYTEGDSLNANDQVTPQEYAKRQQRFLQCFGEAQAQATPLVRLNPDLLTQLHSKTGTKVRVSEVPFRGHALEEAVTEELQSLFEGGTNADALTESALTTDKSVKFIDIMTTLQAPVSPLVVKSLFGPITAAWQASKASHVARDAFWTHRRARSLDQFIPVPQEHLAAMIRGFFTARMLGLIEYDGSPIKIKTPDGHTTSFPDPLIRDWTDGKDLLPVLLESLPLAMIEVERIGTMKPLKAYNALRDYGWRGGATMSTGILEYPTITDALREWIETGNVAGLRDPLTPLRDLATPQERRQAVDVFLEKTIAGYERAYLDYRSSVESQSDRRRISQEPDWPGIWQPVKFALEQLQTAIRSEKSAPIDDDSM